MKEHCPDFQWTVVEVQRADENRRIGDVEVVMAVSRTTKALGADFPEW